MSEFYLVRHGQASFGADNYDKLSPLGHQQAAWLGEYFAARNIHFDGVIHGELVRHRETAESLCGALPRAPQFTVHPGLNEFDFHSITSAYLRAYPEQRPANGADARQFYGVLKRSMHAWMNGDLPGEVPESWQAFETRVADVLSYICQACNRDQTQQRLLVVSSGGTMAMALKHILGFENSNVINLNMQMKNTGVSHFFCKSDIIRLSSFNNVPHLDIEGRTEAITFS